MEYYFKITGEHPTHGRDTRYLVTDIVNEIANWHEGFLAEGFCNVKVTQVDANEYEESIKARRLAEDILFKANSYMNRKLGQSSQSNAIFVDIRTNNNFHKAVINAAMKIPDKSHNLSQENAAKVVVGLYMRWAKINHQKEERRKDGICV